MRIIDSINKLDLGDNKIKLQKCVLKGKKMDSYYIDNNNELELETTYAYDDNDDVEDTIKVYVNGVKYSKNYYTLTYNGTSITITFKIYKIWNKEKGTAFYIRTIEFI